MSVSIVIPCLNEAGSLIECIRLAREAFRHESSLEILIVDNGSSDGSSRVALEQGVRCVLEPKRGYGAAILRGMKEATGDYIVIADADNTYDFKDGAALVKKLEAGADFAIGDRISGEVEKGAMPPLHQYLGTPVLSWVLNQFFGSKVHDINCGIRAIRRECVPKLKLRSPGMEFASEMVIHAQKAGLKFAETPVRYYRRGHGQAKLRTFRDGWRHLRFILLCAPYHLFFLPSFFGICVSAYFFTIDRFGFQVLGSLLAMLSVQVLVFGLLAKAFLWVSDSFIIDQKVGRVLQRFQLEYGIFISAVFMLAGVVFFRMADLSSLIRGALLISLSVEVFFSSFLLSMILSKRQD